ncbi:MULTISPECIES: endonuclease/exonuclease/phosphatase family protein [Streptomyces]|uniref:Endonuclease/exonuclease/phosphatase family protein n=1 Tax=Streptomyces silvae TaxID=2803812 RepID=A0ABU8A3S0_9ACTN|nr:MULTISPECIES: endonuclease/exonuclease/phosphatase family protein [unclassified Streptomyces]WSS69987.1 endonuclease/exonuclease/phosphatase family protein [Streptomyces sp. NBC_01175]WSS76995.1 endonuclease/exonuclease/phosphatase family protein [Streptomyces sp. NBC_01174]MDX3323573.1 endonuclease/exonuclease/phosphatase family protein [Streptomyces sp. ME02-6979-3A]MDX3429257.1 endonuclease/exonuclease/phosphatase family protein [Streptomyces sp. ME01-18a]RPK39339.1 Endonuclease/Exonucle
MSITEPRTVDHQVRADAVSAPQPHDGLRPRLSWRRGRVLAGCTLTLAVLLALRSHLPSGPGQLGSLAQTLAPWSGVAVPVLLVLALARRSAPAQIAVVLTALIWGALFGGVLIDKRQQGGGLTVVSHNVDEANRDPEGTARRLAASGADIIALEELRAAAVPAYERVLNRAYGHHSVRGTVGLWSTYPLSDTESVAIMPWTRALRSTVETPEGPVAVYVAHLASVRVHPGTGFTTSRRNEAARLLADALDAERLERTLLVGDLNGSTDDSALARLTSGMRSAQKSAGKGFGFSWPASFPVVRIDHILARGIDPVSSRTLPATGSDHLPVAATFRL